RWPVHRRHLSVPGRPLGQWPPAADAEHDRALTLLAPSVQQPRRVVLRDLRNCPLEEEGSDLHWLQVHLLCFSYPLRQLLKVLQGLFTQRKVRKPFKAFSAACWQWNTISSSSGG